MKISLYLVDGIFDFRLPNEVSGSFSFDYENGDSKLINVDARDGKWFLYGTSDVKVVSDGIIVDSLELIDNNFYVLRRDDKSYLIYVSSLVSSSIAVYKTSPNMRLIIGNTDSCNIAYNSSYLNGLTVGIGYVDGKLMLEKKGNIVIYINKKSVIDNPCVINNGDELDIYGLRILFLRDMILVNRKNNIYINNMQAGITDFVFPEDVAPQDIDVKDVDLYTKDDYASKAPRIRRVIETKEIKLSQPPHDQTEQELPLILVVGPMVTMAITSCVMLFNVVSKVVGGSASLSNSLPQLITSLTMLVSSLLWPLLTKKFNKKLKEKKKKELVEKYTKYLDEKGAELDSEAKLQKIILLENLVNVDECLENIRTRNINFWSKRSDQSDFLVVRIGVGNELLDAEVNYPDEDFTIEESDLKKKADELVESHKYIENVPIGYSLYDNVITAIMGNNVKTVNFINNIILQLVSFYSYEDLKIVVFTDKFKNEWNYLRYLNHTFSNDKNFRFFCSDYDSSKNVADYLNFEINNRINSNNNSNNDSNKNKPHYIILVDDYDKVKRYDFFETLTESEDNLGFTLIIAENRLSKLPSKCNNFITLNENQSGILKNSYEKQERVDFYDEIRYDINMMDVAKYVSNVPIEFEEGMKALPNSVTFLEMEQVGKIEQLNILNRWNTNDSTSSLRAEVGIDERGSLMYLDLHEKFHGPHGLIAGTTGSGKSEFIITYILSMCINFSPDDVSFILIDYKGGGLALAFENRTTGISLPHLAGTITNLDKAEMDRTLVSIDSEVKRRQALFNQARDTLGESTMDIYKYQRLFHEGRLNEPITHLFIICDEFAELKSQQPDFMDNLISVARIGRSLGVHLILATQKPTGVVNDQIWSNTKFRVCLKVQDESDSKEMLKRTEAAYIKQAGRFYLQVGYDEYFALGQSGWCGAKYYPSDKIVKEVDKSINFIDDCGSFIKSIQASSGAKIAPQGEQLSNIMNSIIDIANKVNKKSRRLWLENIPEVIVVDDLEKKYQFTPKKFDVEALIGEYDAPEKQQQGVVIYNYLKDGNTIIYSNDGSEREFMLDNLIYSSTKGHTVDEINFYFIDYGSEFSRKYLKLPHVGGAVYMGDEEKFSNIFKMIKDEISSRKKLFADFGGEYSNYIKSSGKTLPLKVFILNNYDSIYEANQSLYDILPELVRDSERYGIVYIMTANASNSVFNRLSQNFHNFYAFKVKDPNDYSSIFGVRTKTVPREMLGRGLLKNDGIHEFQVATVYPDSEKLNDFVINYINQQIQLNPEKAYQIPSLPLIVDYDFISSSVTDLTSVPIGVDRSTLEITKVDYIGNLGNIIASNKIENTINFVRSLVEIFSKFTDNDLIVFDTTNTLSLNIQNYYTDNFEAVVDNINTYLDQLIEAKSDNHGIIVIYGISKLTIGVDKKKLEDLTGKIKKYEKIGVIIVDGFSKIKSFTYEAWFTNIFNVNYGVWIGRGMADQNLLHISNSSRDMAKERKNNMGYVVDEGYASLVKFIDFNGEETKEEKEDEQ